MEYKTKIFSFEDGSTVKVHIPELSSEERAKRQRQLEEATRQIMRCVVEKEMAAV